MIVLILTTVILLGALPAAALEPEEPYLVLLQEHPVSLLAADKLTPVAPESGIYLVEDRGTAEAMVEQGVALACAPNCTVELLGDFTVPTPNDSGSSWHWQAIGADYPAAVGCTGKGVRIALVDSGVYVDHPELKAAKIEPGWNYVDGNEDISDGVGHGTFIAGLLAAQPDNGAGICGLCPDATLVPLKAFSATTGTLDTALAAIEDAWRKYDCDIIHMSFGILAQSLKEENRLIMEAALETASEHALLVAAAGNSNGTAAYYPAAYEGVLSVAAVSQGLSRWTSGFYGSQYNDTVDLAAPGGDITSLSTSGELIIGSGTSYAAPLATAAAALLLEREPELTGAELTERLMASAQDLGEPGRDDEYGAGLLRVDRLLMEDATAAAAEDGTYFVQLPQGGSLISAAYDDDGRFLGAQVKTLPEGTFGYYTPAADVFLLDEAARPLTPAVSATP